MGRQTVLFVLRHQGYVDDYCSTEIISRLVDQRDIVLAMPENCELLPEVQRLVNRVDLPGYDGDTQEFLRLHRWAVLANRQRTKAFGYQSKRVFPTAWIAFLRAARRSRSDYNRRKYSAPRPFHMVGRGRAISALRSMLVYLFGLSTAPLVAIVAMGRRFAALALVASARRRDLLFADIDLLPRKSAVAPLVEKLGPSLVVVPSRGHEISAVDAIRSARGANVPSLMLIDNWDNLSSKTLLTNRPDYMGTWGPQSNLHAIQIQGMPPSRVFAVGAPRFDFHYLHAGHEVLSDKKPSRRMILYCGTSLYSREDKVLDILDESLSQLGGDLHILYRPHPARFKDDNRGPQNRFGTLFLDPSSPQNVANSLPYRDIVKPTPLHELLKNSLFVVGGLTSVLLESGMHGKRYIALAHREPLNYKSPRRVYSTYEHYRGVEQLAHITICKSLADLPRYAIEHANHPELPVASNSPAASLDHFHRPPPSGGYGQRLNEVIANLLGLKESRSKTREF